VKASASVKYMSSNPGKRWGTAVFGVASILAMSACAIDGVGDATDDDHTSEVAQDLSANPCTAVKMTAPAQNFTGSVGVPLLLNATAVCPAGQTPEFQYWFKATGAPNWSFIVPYFPGAWSLIPLSPGGFCVTVVVRATGAPEDYQARASAKCGNITP